MRARSYHASPGPGQVNVLWIGLWMICVNTLVDPSTAVDERCCGKVDSRCDTAVMPGRGPSVIHRAIRSYPQVSRQGPGPVAQGRSDRRIVSVVDVSLVCLKLKTQLPGCCTEWTLARPDDTLGQKVSERPAYSRACQAGSRPVHARNASDSVASTGAGFSAAKTRELRTCSAGMRSITVCANSIASAGSARSHPALLAMSHPWIYRSRAGKLKPWPILRVPIGESTSRDRSTSSTTLRAWPARSSHHASGLPSTTAPGGSTGDQAG